MTRTPPTAAVVGGGIIGSWTALHLAEAGVRTTLIEQFPLPHTRGSSHGMSRAFRLLGDPELDRLDYSMGRWRKLEEAGTQTLFVPTGLLNFGPPGDPFLEKHLGVLRRADRPCEWLDSDAVAARFPMLSYPPEWGAAWDPAAGILLAHRCLTAVQARFRELGGEIHTARVESIDVSDAAGRACISLSDLGAESPGQFRTDRLVVCAGPWTAALVPQLAETLRCRLIPVTYWRDRSGDCSVAAGCPILFNARLAGVYALPACEYPGLVKVLYHGGRETDPDNRDLADAQPYVEKVARYVRRHLPGLEHQRPAILESCLYTLTPDDEPVMDRLSDRLVVGCGYSGSGFKHSPASGRMLAALALGQEGSLPEGFHVGRYRFGRF